jgi:hypothetical protein
MPLDDPQPLDPPRREDALANIHALCGPAIKSADEILASVRAMSPEAYGGAHIHAAFIMLILSQQQTFRMIQALCAVVDAVHEGKPLPPWHPGASGETV